MSPAYMILRNETVTLLLLGLPRDIVQTPPFFSPNDINWDTAAAAAADFAAAQLQATPAAARSQAQLPTAMQQTFATARQQYATAGLNPMNDGSLRIPSLHQMVAPNYPSTAPGANAGGAFSFPHHQHEISHANYGLASASAAYPSYLPHWNGPSDLGLGR